MSSEDFLFHLYRGSELLQDDRVHEAKAELEKALGLQPRDPKGQDLLAVVYFRLGMYPHAIEIFQQLVLAYPEERTPRINLALCCLKTGQPSAARELLEEAVRLHPGNARAWAYLGLAHQRLGDYAKAREAFSRGGHAGMAQRMDALVVAAEGSSPLEPFLDLDSGSALGDDISPASHLPPARLRQTGAPPPRPPSVGPPVSLGAVRPLSALPLPPRAPNLSTEPPPAARPLPLLADLLEGAELMFPAAGGVLAQGGCVHVSVADSFVCHLESVRGMALGPGAGLTSEPVSRRTRGRTLPEPLGGFETPLARLVGSGQVVLGPPPSRTLHVFRLGDDATYIRESALAGFGAEVIPESGRLPLGDGDASPVVQLSGRGPVLFLSRGALGSFSVKAGGTASVRAEQVLGWIGRMLPRPLAGSEIAMGQGRFVVFSGEGRVLVDLGI